jgi:hypothetical protein
MPGAVSSEGRGFCSELFQAKAVCAVRPGPGCRNRSRVLATLPRIASPRGVDCAAVSGSIESIFGALSAEGRGFLLGATLLGEDDALAAMLTAPDGERCQAALKALDKLPRAAKTARIGQLARELGSPFPAAVDQIHSSWLRRVLAAEPSDLLGVLVAGAPPSAREAAAEVLAARAREGQAAEPLTLLPEITTELRRLVFGALTAAPPAAGPAVAPLLACTGSELLFEVRRLGARSLGASLASAPVDIKARAMAGVGPQLAEDLREAIRTADNVRRFEGESDVKAAASDGPGGAVEDRLELIGIAALDRQLRSETLEVRRAVAVRLPTRIGKRLLPSGVAWTDL